MIASLSLPNRVACMPSKSNYIVFSLSLTCCLAFSLASCQTSSWHLAASKKDGTVELCLSNGDKCPQAGGVSPGSISVYRWDNLLDNALVWEAEPKNLITGGSINGVVTYGVAPKDWINKLTPPALVCGKAYLVNPGAHYFALKCDGTLVVFDDPHLEEFFRGNIPAAVSEPGSSRQQQELAMSLLAHADVCRLTPIFQGKRSGNRNRKTPFGGELCVVIKQVIAEGNSLLPPRGANTDPFFVPVRKAEDTLGIAVHDPDQIGQSAFDLSGM
jgi:hypothetical protein